MGAPTFPIHVLSPKMQTFFQEMSRSHGTSIASLPTIAMTILSSSLDNKIHVKIGPEWQQNLTVWVADIQSSGSGKSPAVKKMMAPLVGIQEDAVEHYEKALEEEEIKWEKDNPGNKKGMPLKVTFPKIHIITNLTFESLAKAKQQGCPVYYADELTSIITGSDQFKNGKGDGRETLVKLFDDSYATILRATGFVELRDLTMSIIGGTQPYYWKKHFSDPDIALGGTLSRFLTTYTPTGYQKKTNEVVHGHGLWDMVIKKASSCVGYIEGSHVIPLSGDAYKIFAKREEDLLKSRMYHPTLIQGVIPKYVAYIPKIATLLYLMDILEESVSGGPGFSLPAEITPGYIEKAMEVVDFHLSHIDRSVQIFTEKEEAVQGTDVLQRVLKQLRPGAQDGLILAKDLRAAYNEASAYPVKDKALFGKFVVRCGLTGAVPLWYDKRVQRCYKIDREMEAFLGKGSGCQDDEEAEWVTEEHACSDAGGCSDV